MIINTSVAFYIISFFYLIVPWLVLFFMNNDKIYKWLKAICLSLFFLLLFVGVLAEIDFNKNNLYVGLNFESGFFNKKIIINFTKYKLDIWINLIMLIPIGEWIFLNGYKYQKSYKLVKAIGVGIIIGFMIELLQFILPVPRSVQLFDIIFNACSVIIGFIYASIIVSVKKLFKIIFKS